MIASLMCRVVAPLRPSAMLAVAWGITSCSLLVDTSGLVVRVSDGGSTSNDAALDAVSSDAALDTVSSDARDAGPACDLKKPFGVPALLSSLMLGQDGWPRLTADERMVTFHATGSSGVHIFLATRSKRTDPFDPPRAVTELDTSASNYDPDLSADGLTIVDAPVIDGAGTQRIMIAMRSALDAPFGAPSRASSLDGTSGSDLQPFLTLDGSEIWFVSNRVSDFDIYRATRSSGGFGAPVRVGELASTSDEGLPVVSADGLTVYFQSSRSGGAGAGDIWMATRASVTSTFGPPTNVTELNTSADEGPTWLSPDGCRIYLGVNKVGADMYVAERPR
jgi:Tol biopolymer transport system component